MAARFFDTFDPLRIHAQRLAYVLPATETPVAMANASYFSGEEIVGEPPSGWTFNPITGITFFKWDSAMIRLVGGLSLLTPPGGIAHSLHAATPNLSYVLLTDKAFYLIPNQGFDDCPPGEQTEWCVWSCPVEQIIDMKRSPRARGLTYRGWLAITFTDLSMIKLMLGMFFTHRANHMVQAFNSLRQK